jgi:hypothetical protein
MSIEFPNNPQRRIKRARVRLEDTQHHIIFDGKREVWEGEPIGDWTDFRGRRIALRRVEGTFEGRVPDILI